MIKSTTQQRSKLYRLFGYCEEAQAAHVAAITNGKYTKAKDLTNNQADVLIFRLTKNWAKFNIENNQHKYILSLMRQLGWTTTHITYGEISDMKRLSNFLKSKKSPVLKPLSKMDRKETSKVITCLESMVNKKYK